MNSIFFIFFLLFSLVISQPPTGDMPMDGGMGGMDGGMGGMDGGSGTASDLCEGNYTECSTDGTSNYIQYLNMVYDNSTGIFNGSIVSNLCADHIYALFSGGTESTERHSPTCTQWDFPAITEVPAAGALLGALGVTASGGLAIYNALEGGGGYGTECNCDAGLDLGNCVDYVRTVCNVPDTRVFNNDIDSCNGHAEPYHYHRDLVCNYDATESSFHSGLVGIAFDGRGLYGKYEGSGELPNDLDACSGHFGPVPPYTNTEGQTFEGAENVYHYHTRTELPFTLNCYGPAETVDDCKALFDTCDDDQTYYCTSQGEIYYDLFCPCYIDSSGNTYNTNYTKTENCPPEFVNQTQETTQGTTQGTTQNTVEETTEETTEKTNNDDNISIFPAESDSYFLVKSFALVLPVFVLFV